MLSKGFMDNCCHLNEHFAFEDLWGWDTLRALIEGRAVLMIGLYYWNNHEYHRIMLVLI
jgi:hypothetical protein